MTSSVIGLHIRTQRFLSGRLGRLGAAAAKNPLPFIVVPPLVCLLFLIGLVNVEYRTDTTDLWTPDGSYAKDVLVHTVKVWDRPPRFSRLALSLPLSGDATIDTMLPVVYDVQDAMRNLTAVHDGNEVTLGSVCTGMVSPLDMYGIPFGPALRDAIASDPDPAATLRGPAPEGLAKSLVLGGESTGGDGATVYRAVQLLAFLEGGVQVRGAVEAWEDAFLEWAETVPSVPGVAATPLRATRISTLSFDQEIAKSGEPNLLLIAIAASCLMVFMSATIGLYPLHAVNWRVQVAGVGLSLCLFGAAFGAGLTSAIGVSLNMISGVSAFLILALAVDDVFVVVSAFDEVVEAERVKPTHATIPDLVQRAMSHAGPAITLTTATDVIAFTTALGPFASPFKAVRDWCVTTMLGLLAVWVLVCATLPAVLALDEKRRQAGKLALLPTRLSAAAKRRAATTPPAVATPTAVSSGLTPLEAADATAAQHAASPPTPAGGNAPSDSNGVVALPTGGGRPANDQPSLLFRFVNNVYAPLLTKRSFHVVVVVCFAALLGASIYGVTQVEQGFVAGDHATDDSYLQDDFDAAVAYFGGSPAVAYVYFRDQDFRVPSVRDAALNLIADLDAASFTRSDAGIQFWLSSFLEWSALGDAGVPTDCRNAGNFTSDSLSVAAFGSCVASWAATPAGSTLADMVIVNDGAGLQYSRVSTLTQPIPDFIDAGRVQQQYRDALDAAQPALTGVVTTLSDPFFLYGALSDVTGSALVTSIASALVAVVLVMFLFLHPAVAFMSGLVTAAIVTDAVATIPVYDIAVGPAVVAVYITSVGFAIDYVSHNLSAYVRATGTRAERAVTAVRVSFAPVLLGGTSTLIGVGIMAFTAVETYRMFAKLLLWIVVYGVLHGLVLMPVLLVYLGPDPVTVHTDKEQAPVGVPVTKSAAAVSDGGAAATAV